MANIVFSLKTLYDLTHGNLESNPPGLTGYRTGGYCYYPNNSNTLTIVSHNTTWNNNWTNQQNYKALTESELKNFNFVKNFKYTSNSTVGRYTLQYKGTGNSTTKLYGINSAHFTRLYLNNYNITLTPPNTKIAYHWSGNEFAGLLGSNNQSSYQALSQYFANGATGSDWTNYLGCVVNYTSVSFNHYENRWEPGGVGCIKLASADVLSYAHNYVWMIVYGQYNRSHYTNFMNDYDKPYSTYVRCDINVGSDYSGLFDALSVVSGDIEDYGVSQCAQYYDNECKKAWGIVFQTDPENVNFMPTSHFNIDGYILFDTCSYYEDEYFYYTGEESITKYRNAQDPRINLNRGLWDMCQWSYNKCVSAGLVDSNSTDNFYAGIAFCHMVNVSDIKPLVYNERNSNLPSTWVNCDTTDNEANATGAEIYNHIYDGNWFGSVPFIYWAAIPICPYYKIPSTCDDNMYPAVTVNNSIYTNAKTIILNSDGSFREFLNSGASATYVIQ